jgi:hypothetical protein
MSRVSASPNVKQEFLAFCELHLLDCNSITLRIRREYFSTSLLSEARQGCHWSAGKKQKSCGMTNPQLFALRESGLGTDARRLKQKKNGEAS